MCNNCAINSAMPGEFVCENCYIALDNGNPIVHSEGMLFDCVCCTTTERDHEIILLSYGPWARVAGC